MWGSWPVTVTGGCFRHLVPGTTQDTKYSAKCTPTLCSMDPECLVTITQGRNILSKMTVVPIFGNTGSPTSYYRHIVRGPGVIQPVWALAPKLNPSSQKASHFMLVLFSALDGSFLIWRQYLSSGLHLACCGPQHNLKWKMKLTNLQNQYKIFTNYDVEVVALRSTRCFCNSTSAISGSLFLSQQKKPQRAKHHGSQRLHPWSLCSEM